MRTGKSLVQNYRFVMYFWKDNKLVIEKRKRIIEAITVHHPARRLLLDLWDNEFGAEKLDQRTFYLVNITL